MSIGLGTKDIEALAAYFSNLHPVQAVFLFGSQARGTPSPLSDVDLAVLLADEFPSAGYLDFRAKTVTELMGVLRTDRIDLVVLNEATPLLKYQIISSGKVLHEKDASRRISFSVNSLRNFWDTRYLRNISEQYLLKRISTGEFGHRSFVRRAGS